MAESRQALDSAALQTLQRLALLGALDGARKVSCSSLAEDLDTSTQTASRRLQGLETAEHLDRDVESDGQWVEITEEGEKRLRAEYERYRTIFEGDRDVTLSGTVTSGMGEGRHYISLSGYMEQFREKLGYEPFPGTLNVDLDEQSVRRRPQLDPLDPVTIEGWESDDRTYGPAYCHPAHLETVEKVFERAHVISPERTHHGDDHLEVIAPVELREELGLDDGTEVTVRVTE